VTVVGLEFGLACCREALLVFLWVMFQPASKELAAVHGPGRTARQVLLRESTASVVRDAAVPARGVVPEPRPVNPIVDDLSLGESDAGADG
jgi:hypothetical protein